MNSIFTISQRDKMQQDVIQLIKDNSFTVTMAAKELKISRATLLSFLHDARFARMPTLCKIYKYLKDYKGPGYS